MTNTFFKPKSSGTAAKKYVPSVIPFKDSQGIYLKVIAEHNWEVLYSWGFGPNSRDTWDTRISEIQSVNGGKGFHLDVPWGLYEKGDNGGDFSNLRYLKNIADEMYSLGLYLFLDPMIFRDFKSATLAALPLDQQMRYLLPLDMRTHSGLVESIEILTQQGATIISTAGMPSSGIGADGNYAHDSTTNILYGPKANGSWPVGVDLNTNDSRAHYKWDYVYAYIHGSSDFRYDIKAYNTTLQTRFIRFARAICNLLGNHPAVIGITSTESVNGVPMYTGEGGFAGGAATRRAYYDGKTTIMNAVNNMFKRKMVAQAINFPNEGTSAVDPIDYVGEWHATAEAQGFAITGPNSQWWTTALNRAGSPSSPKGANRYYANYTGPRIVQWQGDEFDSSSTGIAPKAPVISSTADYTQRYKDLYMRATVGDNSTKFGMNATHIIMQRTMAPEIWLGGTTNNVPFVPNGITVPSLQSFLNNPAYVPQDGHAGLGTQNVNYIT